MGSRGLQRSRRRPAPVERLDRAVARVGEQREEQVLDADVVLAAAQGLAPRALEDPAGVGADYVLIVLDGGEVAGRQARHRGLKAAAGGFERDAFGVQGVHGVAPLTAQDAEQDVLRADRWLP